MGSFPMTANPPPTPNGVLIDTPRKNPDLDVRSVVLGDVHFKTWYPSFYPDELVGKRLDRLYVCKYCFKYTKDFGPYTAHVKACDLKDTDPPGEIIYRHDSHAIFEIDGDAHQLFAQNLSLFAKLFLDNKSVFFDVASFNYYLLVAYIPPKSNSSITNHASNNHKSTSQKPKSHQPSSSEVFPPHPRQVIGFFSKEKLSWDNNNLACILIFPPWQRKGLGRILMGVSYELSRREGRYGGPEKPLSELGRKGYLQFWQARVAREILGTGTSSPSNNNRGRGGGRGRGNSAQAKARGGSANALAGIRKKTSISLQDLARRCWLLPEDCAAALTSMGVCIGGSTTASVPTLIAPSTSSAIPASAQTASKKIKPRKDGKIVLDKAGIREWVIRSRADLRAPVDLDGFCGSAVDEEEGLSEDEEEDEEEEGSEEE